MQITSPLVSIIIPCFNAEAYVGAAIESALAQTYQNVEVIVIDDGSFDGSLEVIQSFGDRIRFFSLPRRGGGAARNHGIAFAQGEIIQFLDADDLLFPEKISRMFSVTDLKSNEILFSDFIIIEPASDQSYISPRPLAKLCDFRYLLDAERLQTSAPLYPLKSLMAVGGFDESLPCAQEYDLNLRLSLHGWMFRRLPEPLYEVRTRSGSVSSDYVRVLHQHQTIFLKLLEQNPQISLSQAHLRTLFAWRFVRNARLLLNRGDREGALQAASQAKQLGIIAGIWQAFSYKSRWIAYLLGPIRAECLIQSVAGFFRSA